MIRKSGHRLSEKITFDQKPGLKWPRARMILSDAA